jgi:hypothetical protein
VPPTPSGVDVVEHARKHVDRLCWTGILLGLAFTMTNVQGFAAAGAPTWSLTWSAAWLLDPMVSLVLLAILRAEQVTARYGVRTGGWVRTAKWFTLAATYVMNTWQAFTHGAADLVVLHSVPPLVVFVAAEAVTDLRDKLSETARAALTTSEVDPPKPAQPAAQAKRRTSFDEYLSRARAAWQPGTHISPAWIRQVTDCSRGLSSRLATALADEIENKGDS